MIIRRWNRKFFYSKFFIEVNRFISDVSCLGKKYRGKIGQTSFDLILIADGLNLRIKKYNYVIKWLLLLYILLIAHKSVNI